MTQAPVTPLAQIGVEPLRELLHPYGLRIELLPDGAAIPGSYWGEPEAGLVGDVLHLRPDTPVHSALHEGCHYICMDQARRAGLHTDAGGTDTEENAVCYLQALLAPRLRGYSREQLFADMDAWGYHFILGSARAWFEGDAQDARDWLLHRGLIPDQCGFGSDKDMHSPLPLAGEGGASAPGEGSCIQLK